MPRDREGIVYNHDWTNMGQRRTASGSFTFNNVRVMPDEILGSPLNPMAAFATFLFVVTQQVQSAWDKGDELTHAERGEVAIAVYRAKVMATQVGLTITNQIFEVMGAWATSSQYGFDRYWRDLRTFTLHDPLDYKLRDIGNWLLNHELPMPTQYS